MACFVPPAPLTIGGANRPGVNRTVPIVRPVEERDRRGRTVLPAAIMV
ncbi:MAG TPA: hypothetical protein PLD10_20265 [Rhodopila sp.]|nr:hypothetical protein [Rhodopila sp.]